MLRLNMSCLVPILSNAPNRNEPDRGWCAADVECVGRVFISYVRRYLLTAALMLTLSSIDVTDSGREFQSVIVLGVKAYLKQFLFVDNGMKLLAAGELCLRFLNTYVIRQGMCSCLANTMARWEIQGNTIQEIRDRMVNTEKYNFLSFTI